MKASGMPESSSETDGCFLLLAHLSFRKNMGFLLCGKRTRFLLLLNQKPDFRPFSARKTAIFARSISQNLN